MLHRSLMLQARDCWAVAFGDMYNDEERALLAGYDNGDIKLFDLRTNKCVAHHPHPLPLPPRQVSCQSLDISRHNGPESTLQSVAGRTAIMRRCAACSSMDGHLY